LVLVARQVTQKAVRGFDVRAATVEFHGICERCQKN
jgi:Fe2+ or Zn2+ uptake regulation protein